MNNDCKTLIDRLYNLKIDYDYCTVHKTNISKNIDLNIASENKSCPKCIEIIYHSTDGYKDYQKITNARLDDMETIKQTHCTAHILDKTLILNKLIRNAKCTYCNDLTDNKLNTTEIKEPTRKDWLVNEIDKLELVKREIKYAFTNMMNANNTDIIVLLNLLYNMQDNVITSDINRFKKEIEDINKLKK
jgi:hypothetical protein